MNGRFRPLCLLAMLACSAPLGAAERPTSFDETLNKIDIRFEPAQARPGQTVTLKITLDPKPGFFTYPTLQPDARVKSQANRILFPAAGPVIFVGPFEDPAGAKSKPDPAANNAEKLYYPHEVTWIRTAVVAPNAKPGDFEIPIRGEKLNTIFRVCDDEGCFNSRASYNAKLTILNESAIPVEPRYREEVDSVLGLAPKVDVTEKKEGPAPPSPDEKPAAVGLLIPKNANYAAEMAAVEAMLPKQKADNAGFIPFVLTAMFWGLVTLLTPCVFPMIPITVSFFLKQGEKKQHNPLTMALVYTVTIILVLGLAALFFLSFFRRISVDPFMNAALGALFVAFAMSLFGMFDLVLPSFLVRFTSAREGKGGYGGVIFMALSFSIVSFTCVAPFLGGFAGMVSSKQFSVLQLAAGALAFSGTFAAPFFLLAIFPSLLKKVPKSGSWMNTIKVVMGFLELAAALKFFRTAELRWITPPQIFTYDFTLAMYVVVLLFAGMYLLNLYRLPHDEPQEHIGVTRMLVGFLCVSIAIYLVPGLFANGQERQRPRGTIYAWVDAFLLPEPSGAEVVGGGELAWSADLRRSIEEARATGETIFVDFTGVTCTNCKLNEKEVFPKPEVVEQLKKLRLVQIYTDEIPEVFYEAPPSRSEREADAQNVNARFQNDVFGTEQLPLYVLLRPQPGVKGGPVDVVEVYREGKINNIKGFVEFLKKGSSK
jgi:thiol:disulfide interchange protein DsbD